MKRCLFAIAVLIAFANCPKKYAPRVEKIDINYVSSLYDDICRPLPYLSGLAGDTTISIGYLANEPEFLPVLLDKVGFFDFLNSTGIDYVIGNPKNLPVDNVNYFIIPDNLGYVIQNYKGIRFAILSQPKDQLSIEDQVTVTLVQQRSDILWVIDRSLLESEPCKVRFFIENRGVSDTTVTPISIKPDTALLTQLRAFQSRLDSILGITIEIGENNFRNYILTRLARENEVNAILYPSGMFQDSISDTIITVKELISMVSCETNLAQRKGISSNEIEELRKADDLVLWGRIQSTNDILIAHEPGVYLFDLLSLTDNQDE